MTAPVWPYRGVRRGQALINARKLECCHGHPFTLANTLVHVDRHGYRRRMCKQCRRARRDTGRRP